MESCSVVITVSESFSVIGPGFRHKVPCRSIQWGNVTLPYRLWNHLMKNLNRLTKNKEITIAAENGELQFETLTVSNPDIKVVRQNKAALQLPFNADPLTIMKFVFKHDVEELKNMGMWNTAMEITDQISRKITSAVNLLYDYGIQRKDLEKLFVEKFGAHNYFSIKKFVDSQRVNNKND